VTREFRRAIPTGHRVDLVPGGRRVRVSFAGVEIADSDPPLLVRETGYREVVYFPREDVRLEHLVRTDHATFCPFKGEASWWTLRAGDRESEKAVWSYEDPVEAVSGLRGHMAFYADRVDWSGWSP
jgi:uncharacterized protein (DUF427 family)